MNFQSMEKLRKLDGNEVDYTATLKCYDVCAVTESQQEAHPKIAKMSKIKAPMMLSGLHQPDGPISPNAISKFTDHYTRWHDIYLIEDKIQTISTLMQHNKARLWWSRLDRGWSACVAAKGKKTLRTSKAKPASTSASATNLQRLPRRSRLVSPSWTAGT